MFRIQTFKFNHVPSLGNRPWSLSYGFLINLAVVLLSSLLIIACEREPVKERAEGLPAETKPAVNNVLNLYNWDEYIGQSVLDAFEKESGIKVILKVFDSSAEEIANIQSNPLDHDLFCVDGTTMTFFIKSRVIRPLDLSKLPNAGNVPDDLRENLKYGVPYLSGTTGFVINTKYVPSGTKSLGILWDPRYRGKIILLDSSRDVMGSILAYSGFSINSTNTEELKIAEKNALLLKKNGISYGEDSQDNLAKVISGEKWIGQVYSDNAAVAKIWEKGVEYFFPKEGYIKWADFFAMHTNAPHAENAYKFLNFLLRPEIAARYANLQYGQTRILGAKKYLNKELFSNPIVYPSEDDMENGEWEGEVGGLAGEYLRIFNMLKRDNGA